MKTRETPPEPYPMNSFVNCNFLFPSAAQLPHRESEINYTDINFKKPRYLYKNMHFRCLKNSSISLTD